MKKFIVALLVGVGLFAQSAHAIEFYWVLMKADNMLPTVSQWTYKLHKEKADCEKQLVKKAMELDRFLIQKKGTRVWAYEDFTIGNSDTPMAFLECVNFRYDLEGNKQEALSHIPTIQPTHFVVASLL